MGGERGRLRGGAGAFALVATLVLALPARADDRVTFAWEAPSECPTSSIIESAIAVRLGTSRTTARVDVRGRVAREADGYRVRLAMGARERSLLAPSCAQAGEAVVVIVAVAIEEAERARTAPPTAPAAASAPSPDGSAAPAPAPAPATAARPASATPPSVGAPSLTASSSRPPARAFSPYVEAAVSGAFDSGSLPNASPGIALSVDWRALRWLSVGVVASAFLPQTARRADPPAAATVSLVDGFATVCLLAPTVLAARDVDFGACLAAGAGLLPASSASVSNPSSGAGMRPELAATGRVRLPLSRRLALRLDAGPLLDPSRPEFEVRGIGTVHRPAFVTFRGVLGVGLLFP